MENTTTTTTSSPCSICLDATTRTCTGCASIHYCSSICQNKDAALHQLVCKPFANFDKSTCPDADHNLGILFPMPIPGPGFVKVEPKFVWINEKLGRNIVQELIGGDPAGPTRRTRQWVDNEEDQETEVVIIWNQGSLTSRNNLKNPIINKILPQNYWRGAVLIMMGPYVEKGELTQLRDFKVGDMKYIWEALEKLHRNGPPKEAA